MRAETQRLDAELARYFKLIADGERKTDISRQVLCEQPNFESYACFRLLDKDRKGYISAVDILKFLSYPLDFTTRNNRAGEVAAEDMDCYKVVRTYDSKDPGRLSYVEYFFAR